MSYDEFPIRALQLQVQGWRRNIDGLRDGVKGAPEDDCGRKSVVMTTQMMEEMCNGLDSTLAALRARYNEPIPE